MASFSILSEERLPLGGGVGVSFGVGRFSLQLNAALLGGLQEQERLLLPLHSSLKLSWIVIAGRWTWSLQGGMALQAILHPSSTTAPPPPGPRSPRPAPREKPSFTQLSLGATLSSTVLFKLTDNLSLLLQPAMQWFPDQGKRILVHKEEDRPSPPEREIQRQLVPLSAIQFQLRLGLQYRF